MVLDNLPVHHALVVRERIAAAGCRVAYLPVYSPDLNPIEGAFSKAKTHLCRTTARTHEGLMDAFRTVLDTVTVADAAG